MYRRRNVLALAGIGAVSGLGVVSAVTGACSRARPKPAGPDRVTYVTALGSYRREGFAWGAQAKEFFHEVGIDCTVAAGAAGDINLTTLASGRAQFAEVDYTRALIRAGQGAFKDFTLVAALNKTTLVAVMAFVGPLTMPKLTEEVSRGDC